MMHNGYVYETFGISKHFPVKLQVLLIRAKMFNLTRHPPLRQTALELRLCAERKFVSCWLKISATSIFCFLFSMISQCLNIHGIKW